MTSDDHLVDAGTDDGPPRHQDDQGQDDASASEMETIGAIMQTKDRLRDIRP